MFGKTEMLGGAKDLADDSIRTNSAMMTGRFHRRKLCRGKQPTIGNRQLDQSLADFCGRQGQFPQTQANSVEHSVGYGGWRRTLGSLATAQKR